MPASPLPVLRRREPSSMPGGTFNLMRVVCSERPSPRHSPQGFSTLCPVPRQRGHVCATWKNPRDVTTCPRPPHVLHVTTREPFSAPVPLHTPHALGFET